MGPEGGRPGMPAHTVRHTCSGNLGIVNILRYIRSDKFKIAPYKQNSIVKKFFGRMIVPTNGALCLSTPKTPKYYGKSGIVYTAFKLDFLFICIQTVRLGLRISQRYPT